MVQPRALLGGGLRRIKLSYYTSLLAALDRGGELVRDLRVLADGLLLELEAHGDGRRFVGRVERPREAGGLCCVNSCVRHRRGASLSMRGHIIEQTQDAGQRTASMPRGLAAAFIVFAFIVFLWCSSKAFFLQ